MQASKVEQYIQIGIGHERFALDIGDIHEIIKMQDITQIPSSNAYVKGVINLRSNIVPIISLRNRFGLEQESYTKLTRIVVVNLNDEKIGIVVDRVYQVTTFSDIQPTPERIGSIDGSYFSGIGHTSNGLTSIIKLDEILN